MLDHAIVAENLTCRYGDLLAVDHINFDVAVGEILGFLRPNGAGKTTTVKVLTGQMRPKEGKATLLGPPFRFPIDDCRFGLCRAQRRHFVLIEKTHHRKTS